MVVILHDPVPWSYWAPRVVRKKPTWLKCCSYLIRDWNCLTGYFNAKNNFTDDYIYTSIILKCLNSWKSIDLDSINNFKSFYNPLLEDKYPEPTNNINYITKESWKKIKKAGLYLTIFCNDKEKGPNQTEYVKDIINVHKGSLLNADIPAMSSKTELNNLYICNFEPDIFEKFLNNYIWSQNKDCSFNGIVSAILEMNKINRNILLEWCVTNEFHIQQPFSFLPTTKWKNFK